MPKPEPAKTLAVLTAALIACASLPAAAQTPPPPYAPHLDQPNDGARPGNVIGTGMSLPRSDKASNLDGATTHSELAPALPAPPAGDGIQTLLLAARSALAGGRTGEAQEALERAETRALDRSVVAGSQNVPDQGALVPAIGRVRAALAAGNVPAATSLIDAALPAAAEADIPR